MSKKQKDKVIDLENSKVVMFSNENEVIREEWKTSINTMPNEKALKENGTLKLGSGMRGDYGTVANDGVIELALLPMIPGSKALGPSDSNGIFTKTEKGDVSCVFGVTSLKQPLKDVIDLYDSITLDVINDGKVVQKMELRLHEDGWFNEAGEMLEGTYIDEYTIQEATRVSFFTEKGKENKFVLSANSKEGNESVVVTVVDEYVDPDAPPVNPEVPVDPEVPEEKPEEPPVDPESPEEKPEEPGDGGETEPKPSDPEADFEPSTPEEAGCRANGDTILKYPSLPNPDFEDFRAESILHCKREQPDVMELQEEKLD